MARPLDELHDVAIAGAGPAGSMAALHLARRGRRVLLLDRHPFPRDKVCGDALIADAVRCLERAGVADDVRRQAFATGTATLFSPSRIEVDIAGTFLTVRRLTFDHVLLRRAEASGATFAVGRVVGIEPGADGLATVGVAGWTDRVRCRVALVATGATVELASRLALVEQAGPSAIALRCYVRSPVPLDRLVISYDRAILPGYAWIFPLGDDWFNIGCGALVDGRAGGRNHGRSLRDTLRRFVEGFPLARDLWRRASGISPPKGAMLRCGLTGTRPRGPGNVLAIGETIGTTFPFTGEGIGKAMETGELAADIVTEALERGDLTRLDRFARRLDLEIRPKFRGYQVAEEWVSRPWVADLVAKRIRRSRFLQNAVAGILDETVDPRTVFSLGGLVRSFLR